MKLAPAAAVSPIAQAVLRGLTSTPRSLPPFLFYDARGSELFTRITQLAEYYPTRTERAIFEQSAAAILHAAGTPLTIFEIGAGTAEKTAIVLEKAARRQLRLDYFPIDVSGDALAVACERLHAIPGLRVHPITADTTDGLRRIATLPGRKLGMFIGSSIGNYDPPDAVALLRAARAALAPGDAFLLGTDMVKPLDVLLPAYDDPQGVTAEFNRNLLVRINRELRADFAPESFRHVALWNEEASRIEMHLESTRAHSVHIRDLGLELHFAAGERIHTENSYKYTLASAQSLLQQAALRPAHHWQDARSWFTVHLAYAA